MSSVCVQITPLRRPPNGEELMRGYIKTVKQLSGAGGFWEANETGAFIGNVIFVCLQLPPCSFVLQMLLSRRERALDSPKDCSSERLQFITNGASFHCRLPWRCSEVRDPSQEHRGRLYRVEFTQKSEGGGGLCGSVHGIVFVCGHTWLCS